MRELDGVLLPRVLDRVRQRLLESTAEPDQLYEYLKAYLMLGEPEHLDVTQIGAIADLEWARSYPNDVDTRQSLSKHFHALLDGGELRALPIDDSLVAQARSAITQASVPRLMYSRLKLNYAGDDARALRLDISAGLGSDQVFQRKSGLSMQTPIPSLYTKPVFMEATTKGTLELVKQFVDDAWVMGSDAFSLKQSAQLTSAVVDLYEKDYIDQWERILADVQLASFPSVERTTAALGILAAPTSPLRGFLQTVDTHTHLVPGPGEAPQGGAVAAAQQAISDRLGKLLNAGKALAGVTPTAAPGTQVTMHFAALHQALAGPPGTPPGGAPIDRVLSIIGQLQQQLMAVGTGAGDRNPLDQIAQAGGGNLAKSLQAEAGLLPPAVGALVAQVGGRSEGITITQARSELESRFQQNVVQDCNAVVRGRYPFSPHSGIDVPLADFGRLFAYGGLFDTFFKDNLSAIVDTTRRPWTWRAGSNGASIGASLGMLREFEAAQQIRDNFFRPGAQLPELHFTVTVSNLDADATRVLTEIDGQSFEYRHGPDRTLPAVWPGPSPGIAAISFEDRAGGHPNLPFQGPWALFRLLDAGQIRGTRDVHYTLNFQLGGHNAQLLIDAASIRNPLSQHDLSGFRCSP
jgi:type VI secretion system protein ImpL